jgi:hypothetical protein
MEKEPLSIRVEKDRFTKETGTGTILPAYPVFSGENLKKGKILYRQDGLQPCFQ